ncbi:hypothetical protein NY536_26155, partial [Enterobacter hormaechei]|nr:hypothetical protein [Enterobacter hormaechei]
YAEANMRTPVWTAWSPMVRFLVQHRAEIGILGSPTVARTCETWLTKVPTAVGGRAVLWRGEIAELALDTARVRQVSNLARASYGGHSDDETGLFTAALAGAGDRRALVEEFALEMARRRDLSA